MPNNTAQTTGLVVCEWSDATHGIGALQGENRAMDDALRCQRQGCTRAMVTTLRSERFCLEHFCSRCYQLLERIDQRTVNDPASSITVEQALLADECARRTIDVCLKSDQLNNLERARLLDILLWCGDISAAFRPGVREGRSMNSRKPYEKPQLRRSSRKATFCD